MGLISSISDFFRRDRKLGVAEHRGRYDLPLNEGSGTGFLILLVGLMTFLGIMAIAANMTLGNLTARWSSGLEQSATVEIPATRPDGKLRGESESAAIVKSAASLLKRDPNVKSVRIMDKSEVEELLSPWLGEGGGLDNIPLPTLISLTTLSKDEGAVANTRKMLQSVSKDIRIDTHEEWLGDILRLAGSLKFSAFIITIVIGFTTVVAIAGGIRSRMAQFQADIELLHLMGASDLYITRQFQRHALMMALRGSAAGMIAGLTLMGIMALFSRSGEAGMMPDLALGWGRILLLALIPLPVCLLASLTARLTVLRSLARMP